MKGVILAGGSGTRLLPNTKVTNKHLLPVYNKPMIYYPIETMLKAGINDILILPGKDHAGAFAQLLGSGVDFNATFTYRVQEAARGLAYAVGLAEQFVGDDNFMVIFGDNIVFDDFSGDVANFKSGAKVFLKEVHDPHRHGIAALQDNKVTGIIEKPTVPPSNWAVIGAYLYDKKAFEYIKQLKPSPRGELEITDLNNKYIEAGAMTAGYIKGDWFDAGTHESLVDAASALRTINKPVEQFVKTGVSVSPKITAGFLLYNARKYLPQFLAGLTTQDYRNIELCALDNNMEEHNEDVAFIKEHYPSIQIVRPGENTGFAKGHNILARQALINGSDFYLVLNFDVLLESNTVSELVNTLLKNTSHAAASGKLKRWNFAESANTNDHGRTNFIDSAGLGITKEHRFVNRGEGEIDYGQYDKEEDVFGVSGTVALYRLKALEDVAFVNERGEKEYFDELMFMYKEDVDLAYRLQWAGYKALYVPSSVAYHDRNVASRGNSLLSIVRGRFDKNRTVKEWSFVNHHIILSKYFNTDFSAQVVASTAWYEFKSFVYVLLFEPFLLRSYFNFLGLRKKINARRAQVKRREDGAAAIEKWMIQI